MNYYFWSDVIVRRWKQGFTPLQTGKQEAAFSLAARLPVHMLYMIQNIHSVRLRQEDWTAASWDGDAWFLQFLWKFRACLLSQHSSSSQAQQYWWYCRLEISAVRFSITLPVEEWLCLSSQHGQGWVHQHCVTVVPGGNKVHLVLCGHLLCGHLLKWDRGTNLWMLDH